MLSQSREEEFLEQCETRLSEYEKGKDIVVINGWRNGGFSVNSALARHMAAPVLLAMDYIPGETPSACFDRAVRSLLSAPQRCTSACVHAEAAAQVLSKYSIDNSPQLVSNSVAEQGEP